MVLFVLPDSITTAAAVLVIFGVVAIAIYFLLQFRIFAGYRSLTPEVRQLAAELGAATVRREAGDVLITGTYQRFPVALRFSNRLDAPGVLVRLSAPIDLTLSVFPKTGEVGPGRAPVQAGNPRIDGRFALRSDDPRKARLFFTNGFLTEIDGLCCSSQTRLAIRPGVIEHLEMLIPADAAQHLGRHLRSLAALAELAAQFPGSEKVKIAPLSRRSLSPVFAVTFACLVLFTGWLSYVGYTGGEHVMAGAPSDPLASPAFKGWRIADGDEFDYNFANWLVRSNAAAVGRVTLSGDEDNSTADVFLLAGADDSRRVVIVRGGSILYDSRFPHLSGMVRIPRERMAAVDWSSAPSQRPNGDGVLLVRDAHDPATGTILYAQDGQVLSGIPRDYQDVRLQVP